MLSNLTRGMANRRAIALVLIVVAVALSVGIVTALAARPTASAPLSGQTFSLAALPPESVVLQVPENLGTASPRRDGFVLNDPGGSAKSQDGDHESGPGPVAPTDDCLRWRIMDNPDPVQNPEAYLWDVAALASNNVWAVGDYNGGYTMMIKHWDGVAWTVTLSNIPGSLHGVAALSANDIWAVGQANGVALTMHWNGSTWTTIPNPAPATSALYDVSVRAANDIWAVGTTGVEGSWRAFSMRWNGTAWSVVNTPQPPNSGDQYELYGVTPVSANDAWAVGDYDRSGSFTTWIIMRWNGTVWSVWSGFNAALIGHLRDVAAISSSDVWAVGQDSRGSPLALHWDGVQWASYYLPLPAGALYGLSARASNDVWASGGLSSIHSPVAVHWDGVAWTAQVGQGTGSGMNNDFFAVSARSSSDVWAVGADNDAFYDISDSLIERYSLGPCPSTTPSITPTPTPVCGWSQVASPSRPSGGNSLNALALVSANEIWAVGTGGGRTLILRWNGTAWSEIASPSPGSLLNVLYGVTVVSPSEIWAVGAYSHGTRTMAMTMRWNGTAWSVIFPPNAGWDFSELRGVDWVAGGGLWAVGSYGNTGLRYTFVLRWNGTAWDIVASPNPHGGVQGLYAITAISANDVWAVGYQGPRDAEYPMTIRWTGATWNVVDTPASAEGSLYAVAAVSAADIWAAGELGYGTSVRLLHWNGTTWTLVSAQTEHAVDLHGLAAVASNDVWAVGESYWYPWPARPVMHWNGTVWTTDVSASVDPYMPLNAVAAVSASNLWAVGSSDLYYQQKTLVMRNTQPCLEPTVTPTPGPPTATPTPCTPGQFSDVPPTNTFYPYVTCLVNRGIISGYSDCTFRPNNPVTRGQLSKIVSNSAGFNDPPGAQMFEDVAPGSTFYDWVQRLASRGYIGGYACGGEYEPCVPPANLPYFRPNAGATRGQLTKIVSNAAGFTDTIPPSQYTFADVLPANTFWVYVERLLLNRPGVMSGYQCGGPGEPCDVENRAYFRPNNPLTRGQTSKIVANTFFPGCQTLAVR